MLTVLLLLSNDILIPLRLRGADEIVKSPWKGNHGGISSIRDSHWDKHDLLRGAVV